MPHTSYESYPLPLALVSGLLALSVYGLGAYLLSGTTPLTVGTYLVCCAGFEVMVLKRSCVHCYYYGRLCGRGRGKLSSWLFKRGDPSHFAVRQICWWGIAPQLLATLPPLLVGAFLLLEQFELTTLAAMAAILGLSLGGNALVRRSYACKYCKQRELGCPALAMFSERSAS